ncbi:hypothetical protein SprV_0100475300 [Sparganum proliferum]
MTRPQDTALARFYDLPKVHKDGAPLRPIVSLKGTPTYGLAKWLFRRLKFLTAESDTTVSSSAQFLEKLKGDLAIETIELLLQSKYDGTENRLGYPQILQLLQHCLRTYFTFDGTIYEQVKGTVMGPPILRFIVEAVLQRLESLVFQHHKPKFWARHVDDTFVVIERDRVLTFQEHLNAVFPDIQFTMKEEENNQLAFLDVLVRTPNLGGRSRMSRTFRKLLDAFSHHLGLELHTDRRQPSGVRHVDEIFNLMDLTADTDVIVLKLSSEQSLLKFPAESETNNETASLNVLLHGQED